jgi:hypothetical protein
MHELRIAGWIGALLALASGCATELCDPVDLAVALDAAEAGEVVELGACRIEGTFVVPADVTLRGKGPSTILASREGAVVTLATGSRLESLRVESAGTAAVVVRGAGRSAVTNVELALERGIGLGIDGGTSPITLSALRVTGPVRSENAMDARWIRVAGGPVSTGSCPVETCECTPGDVDAASSRVCDRDGRWSAWTATIGLYARDAVLTLSDVEVTGLASHGVVADRTELEWTGGAVRDVIGVGVLLREGSSSLTNVTVEDVVSGLRGVASYGVAATDGHALTSTSLAITGGERYGLVQLESTGTHTALAVRDQGDVGVWVERASQFALSGGLSGNGFAGIVVTDSANVSLADARIETTRLVRRNVGTFGALELGDGLHLMGANVGLDVRRVRLAGNERVGVLLDLATTARFEQVEVDAAGDAFGALAGSQDPAGLVVSAPAGWDAGITRLGAAVANDVAASGAFDAIFDAGPEGAASVRGLVAPMY